MESARPDVFCFFIDGCRDPCQFIDCIFPEGKLDSFCFEQSDVLLDKGVVRFCKNPDEIILAEGSSSTLIGIFPAARGIKSEGFEMWNAPAAIKRICSSLPDHAS